MIVKRSREYPGTVCVLGGNEVWPANRTMYRFKKVCRRANIADATIHGLRHTYAAIAVMSGVKIYKLMKLIGHSDIRQTMRYAHLSREHLADQADLIQFDVDKPKVI